MKIGIEVLKHQLKLPMPLLCRKIQSSGSYARLLYSHVEASGSDISAGRGLKCFKTWTYAIVEFVERCSSSDHTATRREADESLETLACSSSESEEQRPSCFGRTEAVCTGEIPIQLRHWRSALFRYVGNENRFTLGVGLRQFSHSPLPSSQSQRRVLRGWNGGIRQSWGTQDAGMWGSSSRSHMEHAHDHSHGLDDEKGGDKVLKLGFWADILLSVTKGAAGYISGSAAIIADAAHSVSDIVSVLTYLCKLIILILQNAKSICRQGRYWKAKEFVGEFHDRHLENYTLAKARANLSFWVYCAICWPGLECGCMVGI